METLRRHKGWGCHRLGRNGRSTWEAIGAEGERWDGGRAGDERPRLPAAAVPPCSPPYMFDATSGAVHSGAAAWKLGRGQSAWEERQAPHLGAALLCSPCKPLHSSPPCAPGTLVRQKKGRLAVHFQELSSMPKWSAASNRARLHLGQAEECGAAAVSQPQALCSKPLPVASAACTAPGQSSL